MFSSKNREPHILQNAMPEKNKLRSFWKKNKDFPQVQTLKIKFPKNQ
jgi:hypothetical protein